MFPQAKFWKITNLETAYHVSGGLNSTSNFSSQNLASHNIQDLWLANFLFFSREAEGTQMSCTLNIPSQIVRHAHLSTLSEFLTLNFVTMVMVSNVTI